MALKNKSLILYGLQITADNSSIDFKISGGGSELMATLVQGFYSVSSILLEVKRAMQAADPSNTYTVTADRTVNGGTEVRITISTSGVFLSILFATGSRTASSAGPTLGFSGDQTGSTTYTGTSTVGTSIISEYVGYNFVSPDRYRKVQGSVNISASGEKEAIVFQIQRFIKVQFKYEPEAKTVMEWSPFWDWAIQQRPFDFTPDYVLEPNTFYEVTLEKTPLDQKGIGFLMNEMLPKFPFFYDTGLIEMRVRAT